MSHNISFPTLYIAQSGALLSNSASIVLSPSITALSVINLNLSTCSLSLGIFLS